MYSLLQPSWYLQLNAISSAGRDHLPFASSLPKEKEILRVVLSCYQLEMERLLILIFMKCFWVLLGEKQLHSFSVKLLSFATIIISYCPFATNTTQDLQKKIVLNQQDWIACSQVP